jgi:hypothetical protein
VAHGAICVLGKPMAGAWIIYSILKKYYSLRKLFFDNTHTTHIADVRLAFPDWENLLETTLFTYWKATEKNTKVIRSRFNEVMGKLKYLHKVMLVGDAQMLEDLPMTGPPVISGIDGRPYHEKLIDTIVQRYKDENEFYAIYDNALQQYIYIDKRVNTILGITPGMFNKGLVKTIDGTTPLIHPLDLNHVFRFETLARLSMSLPFSQYINPGEHYILRYRMLTQKSSIAQLSKRGYTVVNKLCYAVNHPLGKLLQLPGFRVERYYVYSDDEIDHPTRTFVCGCERTTMLNHLSYLFNAYLLGIPAKYLCLLEERRTKDRNKAVANAMNEKLHAVMGLDHVFDEAQVANCFAKTIRPRVEDVMCQCNQQVNSIAIKVQSDQ